MFLPLFDACCHLMLLAYTDGMIRVDYNGLIADIREEDLEAGLQALRNETPEGREKIMASVEAALTGIMEKLKNGQPITQTEQQNTANDIGIWFANEVLEGRAGQYKKAVQ